jgi:hypothetical protein
MSRSIKKYKVRERRKRYEYPEDTELQDAYYTKTAKSHDRKIKRRKDRFKEPENPGK